MEEKKEIQDLLIGEQLRDRRRNGDAFGRSQRVRIGRRLPIHRDRKCASFGVSGGIRGRTGHRRLS